MALLPWDNIHTVLLDMDGTLLDLHFDSHFWLEHLPATLAKREGKSIQAARQEMHASYAQLQGQLQWYCLDYWAQRLNLDIMKVKREVAHLIDLRADTIPFLDALRESKREVVLVTNAHPDSLSLKVEKTALDTHIDVLISTHEFGVTKESQLLWQKLQARLGFDPRTTLFVDDSQVILDAAKTFGIAHTLGITNPDSQAPENELHGHQVTNNYLPLIADILNSPFAGEQ